MKRGETAELAAKKAGFGNLETYRQAKKVVDHGTHELQEAMDEGKISVSAAAKLVDEPPEVQ